MKTPLALQRSTFNPTLLAAPLSSSGCRRARSSETASSTCVEKCAPARAGGAGKSAVCAAGGGKQAQAAATGRSRMYPSHPGTATHRSRPSRQSRMAAARALCLNQGPYRCLLAVRHSHHRPLRRPGRCSYCHIPLQASPLRRRLAQRAIGMRTRQAVRGAWPRSRRRRACRGDPPP